MIVTHLHTTDADLATSVFQEMGYTWLLYEQIKAIGAGGGVKLTSI